MARLQFLTLQPGVVALINTYDPALPSKRCWKWWCTACARNTWRFPVAWGCITVTSEGLTIGFEPKPR